MLLLLFNRSVMSNSSWPHGLQHARLSCPSPSPGACSNSCPLSQWCHPTNLSSVIPFSSCLHSFPASGSFLTGQVFISGGQSEGASASATVLPMNSQDWSPLGLTGLISLQCKGLSGIFSNTTIQKHQFFSTQPSLGSNFHIHTWQLEKPQLWIYEPLLVNLAFYSIMNTGNKPQEYEQCLSMTWLPVNIKHIFLSYYSYFSHYFKIAMVIESSNRYSILMY